MIAAKPLTLSYLVLPSKAKTLLRYALLPVLLSLLLSLATVDQPDALIDVYFSNFIPLLLSSFIGLALVFLFNASQWARSFYVHNILLAAIISLLTYFCIAAFNPPFIQGNIDSSQSLTAFQSFKVLLFSLITALLIMSLFWLRSNHVKSMEATAVAKYSALQSRMNPHFLFNSLNTVAHLVHKNADQAEEAILDLADIMRTILDKRQRISLKEELDVTIRYLRMESLRMGKKRLTVIWDMNQNALPLDMQILPLLLQPLVENGIHHGIQPSQNGGTLSISLYEDKEGLAISVSNPIPKQRNNLHSQGNKIAQDNMKQRLHLAYGNRAKLQISKTDEQYRVSFIIPRE